MEVKEKTYIRCHYCGDQEPLYNAAPQHRDILVQLLSNISDITDRIYARKIRGETPPLSAAIISFPYVHISLFYQMKTLHCHVYKTTHGIMTTSSVPG
jgi:hypothetical protein